MEDESYTIVRFYADQSHPDHGMIVKEGLSLEDAQEHCQDDSTHEEGVWFDGYRAE